MKTIIVMMGVYLIGEIAAYFFFKNIAPLLVDTSSHSRKEGTPSTPMKRRLPWLKGFIERMVLFIGLYNGFSQVLIAFGALKIGTRIKDEENKVSNDFFLIGNLISILFVLLYTILTSFLVTRWTCN